MNLEHENTARKLKDEPLFATRQWRCRFGIHTWLLWDDTIETRRSAYTFVEQYRKCGCCGKVQRRQLLKE